MKYLSPHEIEPQVKFVNYMDVPAKSFWGFRTIPDLEFILIIEGEFHYEQADGANHVLKSGEVLCIMPDIEHRLECLPGEKQAMFSCIHCELSPCGCWALGDYRLNPEPALITPFRNVEIIRELFWRANTIFFNYSKYRESMLSTAVKQIILHLADYWSSLKAPALSLRMEKMIRFLKEHADQPVSRHNLAKAFDLSPEYVNALFKKELGITPTDLLHRERIYLAYRYLKDQGLSVEQAAEKVGFHDAFYFSKLFKRIMLFNPSEIRNRSIKKSS